jgi:CheY-like chemotaxis protein
MIDIQLHLGENLATIYADPTQMDQILMNLTVNARDAMPEGGRLILETATVFLDEEYAQAYLEAKSGHHVRLTVTDTGAGMDGETVQHIFEPFYTTKAVGEGTGLGLAMVHSIVQRHGGHIRCFSEPGEGTTFKLYFPALVSTEDNRQPENITMPRGGSETILLVDDDDTIRELGARMLRKVGYTVLTAANGKRALEEFQVHCNEIDLVILDLIMPEMGGKQCLEGLLGMDPAVTVVIASGYSASGPDREWLATAVKGLVEKPYDMPQMLRVVREVLDAHREVYA